MISTALVLGDGKQIQITKAANGATYRIDLYPSNLVTAKYWTENTRSYAALITSTTEKVLIKVSSDPKDSDFGNVIFGSSVPETAYSNANSQLSISGLGANAANLAQQLAGNSTLASILSELINAKAFTDLLVEDNSGKYLIRRAVADQTTGLITDVLLNLDGSPLLTAVELPLRPIKAEGQGKSILEARYTATVSKPDYSINNTLTNIRILDSATGLVNLSTWYNLSTQTLILTPPPISDYQSAESVSDTQLRLIASQLTPGPRATAESLAVAPSADWVPNLPLNAATEDTLALISSQTLVPDIRLLTELDTVSVILPRTAASALNQAVANNLLQEISDGQLLANETLDQISLSELASNTVLQAISANTLQPNIRPLTASVDTVSIESATIATIVKQEEQNSLLTSIDTKLSTSSTAGGQDAIVNSLAQILVELSKQKEFEDLIVQDTEGSTFIRREVLDETNNQRTITIENFDGTLASPVGLVNVVKQIKNNSIVTRNYYANSSGNGFTAGDSLATLQIVNGETNAVTMLGWFNITTQVSIDPPNTSAIKGYEDLTEELLTKLVSQLPTSLGAKLTTDSLAVALPTDLALPLPLGAATEQSIQQLIDTLGILNDTSIPLDDLTEATIKGLLRLIANRLVLAGDQELQSLGPLLESDISTSPSDFGSIKAILRGAWLELAANQNISQQIDNQIAADLGVIKDNTSKISQFAFQLAQDSTGVVFLIKTDSVLGTSTNINVVTGLPFTPVGQIELTDPNSGSNLQLEPNEYQAVTNSPGNWAIGDILTRVLVVNTLSNLVTGTIWQAANGTPLSTIPVLGVDVEDTDRTQLVLIKAQPTAGIPIVTEALPTGSGLYGWLSYIRSGIAAVISQITTGNNSLATIATNSATPSIRALTTATDSIAVGSLPAAVVSDIAAIKVNTARIGQYEFQLVTDTSATVFVARYDTVGGTVGNFTLAGLSYTPVGAVKLSDASSGGSPLSLEINEFEAQTNNGVNWTIGDVLTRVLVINTSTGAISSTIWQSATGTTIPAPVLGTDAIDTDKRQLALLKSIDTKTPVLGQALAASSCPVVLTATQLAALTPPNNLGYALNATVDSLLKPGGSLTTVTSLGQVADTLVQDVIGGAGATAASLTLNGRGVATFSLLGTWSGTVQVQLSGNNVDWFNLTVNNAVYDLRNKVFVNNSNITANGLYQVNVGGVSFARLIATSWTSGLATAAGRASIASPIVTVEGQVLAQIANTNLLIRSDTNSSSVDLNGTIVATAASSSFTQNWGISRYIEVSTTALGLGTTYVLEIQEAFGTGWRTVYRFAPISTSATFRCPLLPNNSTSWRYLETITGATPSVTRSITRIQSNQLSVIGNAPLRSGAFNVLNTGFDIPLYGRTRRIVSTNRTATLYYWQIHDSANAIAPGAVPGAAEVYQLPAGSTLPFTIADFGQNGTVLGVNPRLALSTTFNIYTPLSAVAANTISYFVESL
jgi:hypothetical protein